jgi:hypothetical protein
MGARRNQCYVINKNGKRCRLKCMHNYNICNIHDKFNNTNEGETSEENTIDVIEHIDDHVYDLRNDLEFLIAYNDEKDTKRHIFILNKVNENQRRITWLRRQLCILYICVIVNILINVLTVISFEEINRSWDVNYAHITNITNMTILYIHNLSERIKLLYDQNNYTHIL